jgi:zinc transporter ZupT
MVAAKRGCLEPGVARREALSEIASVEPLIVVFAAALLTAIATGLGALPLALANNVSVRVTGWAYAAAAGLMLAASHALIVEGGVRDMALVLVGAIAGLFAVVAADRWLEGAGEVQVADLAGADARRALLILGVMTAHSFAEGVGVGVSFSGSEGLGAFITTAIALHNVPEGLAIALVLVPRGTPVWKAAAWAVFTSLPQPLMAVPSFLFVEWARPLLPVGLGFAAGAMLWMVFAELVPDALERASSRSAGAAVVLAFSIMLAVQHFGLH